MSPARAKARAVNACNIIFVQMNSRHAHSRLRSRGPMTVLSNALFRSMRRGDAVNPIRLNKAAFVLITALVFGTTAVAQTPGQNIYAQLLKTGMDRLKAGDYQTARDTFEQAVRNNDSAFEGHLGLGMALFQLRDDASAERELNRTIELNSKSSDAYALLGELYYRKDNFEKAVSFWEKAVELNPNSAPLRARLERIKKEHGTEKDFNRDVTSHFLIKYEGNEKIEAGRIILRILEDAYGVVGRGLSYYPNQEIQVILYSNEQFQEVTDAPGWAGALYDGKIRIPIGGIERETPGLRRLLYHEYTHAAVRSITPRVPTWLNEGLAQYFEGREIGAQQAALLKRVAQMGKLPQLVYLEGSFMGLGGNQAQYAYLYSLSAVRYLIDTCGLHRAKSVLDELGRGADTAAAVSNGTTRSYDEFERGWKRSLE
jgi:tetratricopeptide (TPR) repeat protein